MNDGMSSVAQNAASVMPQRLAGAIIAGFDVHLRQITFDCLDSETGEITRGRIGASPSAVEEWVGQFSGREVHVAMEACTGWLFVAEAVTRAGAVAHLAETVETRALRVASVARRPIARTRCGCASCWRRGGCPSVDRARARASMAIATALAQGAYR